MPATALIHLKDVSANSDGMLFRGSKVLSESFPSPQLICNWVGSRGYLKFLVKNFIFRHHTSIDRDAFWITDTWSGGYFHWITDALPRLLAIHGKMGDATLLLPGKYEKTEFILSSLIPFKIQDVKFVHEPFFCKNLNMPTHTAPTGNYNERLIRGLRSLYTDFYQRDHRDSHSIGSRVYISRRKAQKRKISNEEECEAVLSEFGFKTYYFEDYSFKEQAKIALDTQYLISNHGAGLTNMLFMKSGSSVFELRLQGDSHSNCYFSLASSLNMNYFYQLCVSKNPYEKSYNANLIVDTELLRQNIKQLLVN